MRGVHGWALQQKRASFRTPVSFFSVISPSVRFHGHLGQVLVFLPQDGLEDDRVVLQLHDDVIFSFEGVLQDLLGQRILEIALDGPAKRPRAELEVRAGGAITQNSGRVYSLTQVDRDALASSGLDLDELLEHMNDQATYEADPQARAYVERYADFTGEIQVPVLMAHNVEDSISPVENATAYLQTLQAAGTDDLLVRTYTDLPGHCNFTTGQMLKMVEAMEGWLDTGIPPDDDAFPTSLNFVPGFDPAP